MPTLSKFDRCTKIYRFLDRDKYVSMGLSSKANILRVLSCKLKERNHRKKEITMTIYYLFIFVNTKVYVTKVLCSLKFLACLATVMVLHEYTATIKLIKLLEQINDRLNRNNKP